MQYINYVRCRAHTTNKTMHPLYIIEYTRFKTFIFLVGSFTYPNLLNTMNVKFISVLQMFLRNQAVNVFEELVPHLYFPFQWSFTPLYQENPAWPRNWMIHHLFSLLDSLLSWILLKLLHFVQKDYQLWQFATIVPYFGL